MTGPASTAGTRLYRRALRLLPPSIPDRERDEMASILEELAAAEGDRGGRVVQKALRALPGVALREWVDWVKAGSTSTYASEGTMAGRWNASDYTRHLRHGARSLLRNPSFSWATVLLVGLGVGAVTTVFTLVDNVLLRPLPYAGEERLVLMTRGAHPGPLLRSMDGLESLELWSAATDHDVNLITPDGDPVRLREVEVTPSFFALFNGRPHLGRVLVDEDQRNVDVAVVTHGAWVSVWGSDPGLVGSTIVLDGAPHEVVGVLAESFVTPEAMVGRDMDVLTPVDWSDPVLNQATVHRHEVVGRLQPEVGLSAANEELQALANRLAEQYPDGNFRTEDGELQRFPFELLRDITVERARTGLVLLLAAVGLLLLVACANVAHLFLARGLSRQREMSVRRALGASIQTLAGQLTIESLIVGGLGAVLGVVLALGSLTAVGPWLDTALPRGTSIALDIRVLGFAALLSTAAALVFGLVPALRTVGSEVGDALRGGGAGVTGSRRIRLFRGSLVVIEVALSLVLIATSGLLLRSFLEMTAQDPGVAVEGTWVVPVDFPEDPEDYALEMDVIRQALLDVPGVTHVSYGMEGPFQFVGGRGCCWQTSFLPEPNEQSGVIRIHAVEDSFFDAYGMHLVAGGLWEPASTQNQPFATVVGEGLAIETYGSAERAVGRTFEMGGDRSGMIVGVANDTRYYGLDQGVDRAIYVPVRTLPFPIDIGTFGIRIENERAGLGRELREAIWSVRPALPLPTVIPLAQWVNESSAGRRLGALILTGFGVLALLLAAGGLYGTLLYSVNQRRHELGIRMALGAHSGQIQNLVVRQGLVLAAVGALFGLTGTWYARRFLEQWLYGISTSDAVSLAGAVVILMATAALASWVPAFRASRTDPRSTLAAE